MIEDTTGFSRWSFNFLVLTSHKLRLKILCLGESIPIVNVWLVGKLNYHRLKPGGVRRCFLLVVVVRLKDHRLKPGGVAEVGGVWLLTAVILNVLSNTTH